MDDFDDLEDLKCSQCGKPGILCISPYDLDIYGKETLVVLCDSCYKAECEDI